MRSGIPNFTKEPVQRQIARACQKKPLMPESPAMMRVAVSLSFLSTLALGFSVFAQTVAPSPGPSSEAEQLQALAKKIDEQNAKIDTLSQQILKLEQHIANMRPGVMIGEATPAPATTTEPSPHAVNGNTHTVARGETLTSIAKMHGVTVSELQKLNHIENDRKLQIGQTIMIPGAATPTPSSSPGQ
jgi:LysM repeat protein